MKKELTWFQQSFQGGNVTYNVLMTDGVHPSYGFDYSVSPDDLQSNALSRNKTTWDEDDIIEIHGTRYAEVITLHPGPVVNDGSEAMAAMASPSPTPVSTPPQTA